MRVQPQPFTRTIGEVVDAGVDWLSASATRGARGLDLSTFVDTLLQVEEQEGNQRKEVTWRGYRGYSAGRARWLQNDDYVICSIEGALAQRWHRSVCQLADNVSRIDLQTTVLADAYSTDDWARQAWDMLGWTGVRVNSRKTYTLIENSKGGSTLYVGKRASDVYLRLYDKEAKSGSDYQACWRFEVELKNKRAVQSHAVGKDQGYTPGLSAAAVYEWFARSGMVSPFLPIDGFSLTEYPEIQPMPIESSLGSGIKYDLPSHGLTPEATATAFA